MAAIFTKRITKELKELSTNPPAGILVEDAETNMKW
jgi:ubiquitin-protein ligase